MIRNVSLVNGQTDRLALPYRVARGPVRQSNCSIKITIIQIPNTKLQSRDKKVC
jgi:hypothetical protein